MLMDTLTIPLDTFIRGLTVGQALVCLAGWGALVFVRNAYRDGREATKQQRNLSVLRDMQGIQGASAALPHKPLPRPDVTEPNTMRRGYQA